MDTTIIMLMGWNPNHKWNQNKTIKINKVITQNQELKGRYHMKLTQLEVTKWIIARAPYFLSALTSSLCVETKEGRGIYRRRTRAYEGPGERETIPPNNHHGEPREDRGNTNNLWQEYYLDHEGNPNSSVPNLLCIPSALFRFSFLFFIYLFFCFILVKRTKKTLLKLKRPSIFFVFFFLFLIFIPLFLFKVKIGLNSSKPKVF